MRPLVLFFGLLAGAHAFALCKPSLFARLFGEVQLGPKIAAELRAQSPVIEDFSSPLGGKPLLVQLPGEGHLIYGTGEIVTLEGNRRVILLRDSYGGTHLLDPNLAGTVFHDASRLGPESAKLAKQFKKKPAVRLDEKDLKDRFCRGFGGALGKATSNANKVLDQLLSKANQTAIMKELAKSCAASAAAITAFSQIGDRLFYDDARSNLYAAHRSNFNWGLAGMVVVHNCLSVASPAHSKILLTAGLGAYVTGNTYFELGLGQPDLDGKTPVKTDAGDFATGTAGILLYALYGRMIERRLDTNFRQFCK